MKTNKILVFMVIILSLGLTATTMKILSMDKKIENNNNPIVVEKPESPVEEEIPIVEEPIIKEEPPVVETPSTENPPKVEKPNKVELPKEPVIVKPKYISTEEAIRIGKDKVGEGAKLIEIESDLDDNPPKYNLELVLGNYEYQLEIHAITGAVIDFERDEIDD